MRILFVSGKLGYIDPISIAFLSAVAKRRGHETFFVSPFDYDCFVSKVKEIRPTVVAYSAYSSDMPLFRSLNEQAKRIFSFVSIIGGPHTTFAQMQTLSSGFDACAIGEGEETFDEFLARVEKGEPFDGIRGLVTRESPNLAIRPLIQDLDTLPFPDRDFVLSTTILANTAKKTFFTSRGCPFQCSYCLNPALQKLYHGKGQFVRRFSVNRVIDEILHIKKNYRLDFVKFDDDVFAIKADDWLREFADVYPRKVKLPFNCLVRLDHVDDELLSLLKRAGCHSVTTSIDSASDEVRTKILHRKMSNDLIFDTLHRVHGEGIKSFVNFIIDLPGATIDDEIASIELARRAGISYTSYTFLTLFPGTWITKYCIDNGIVGADYEVPLDMTDEPMLCSDPDEKRIKMNLMNLGHIAQCSLPGVCEAITKAILTASHSEAFRQMRKDTHRYYMENIIYLCKDNIQL